MIVRFVKYLLGKKKTKPVIKRPPKNLKLRDVEDLADLYDFEGLEDL